MSVSLYSTDYCKEMSLGFAAFARFRAALAYRVDAELGALYSDFRMLLREPARVNKRLNEIAEMPALRDKQDILDFLCMSDCDGEISADTCAKITELLPETEEYHDLYALLRYCAENSIPLCWC